MLSGISGLCRYCCKSPRLPGAKFPAVKKLNRRPPIRVPSIALPRSSASLSSDDEVPRIFTRKSRLKPGKSFDHQCKRTFATKSVTSGSRRLGLLCQLPPATDMPVGGTALGLVPRWADQLGPLTLRHFSVRADIPIRQPRCQNSHRSKRVLVAHAMAW